MWRRAGALDRQRQNAHRFKHLGLRSNVSSHSKINLHSPGQKEHIQARRSGPENVWNSSDTFQQRRACNGSQRDIKFKRPGLKRRVRIQVVSAFQDQHSLISCLVYLPVPRQLRPWSRTWAPGSQWCIYSALITSSQNLVIEFDKSTVYCPYIKVEKRLFWRCWLFCDALSCPCMLLFLTPSFLLFRLCLIFPEILLSHLLQIPLNIVG